MWQLVAAVGLWWVASTATTIASRSVMLQEEDEADLRWPVHEALSDLRWVELTALQQLVGAAVAAVWLKAVVRTSLHPANASKRVMFIAALCNVLGNIGINLAYTMITSSATLVIKACEPLFTLLLLIFLCKGQSAFNFPTLLSVSIVIAGACAYVLRDSSVIIGGLFAALGANIFFPIRNIALKKLTSTESLENALQNYAVVSLYSLLLLVPGVGIKLAIVRSLHVFKPEVIISAIAYATHCIAAIAVMQFVSLQTHPLLKISKHIVVIVANIVYFYSPVVSFGMSVGLVLLFIGLFLFQAASNASGKSGTSTLKYIVLLIFTILCLSMTGVPYSSQIQIQVSKHLPLSISSTQHTHRHSCSATLPNISTAWVFNRQIPENVVSNIKYLSEQTHCVPFHVYCGTSQCVDAVLKLNKPDVTAEFLVVSTIVKGTPLEHWLAQHPINKVLAGVEFEKHLHEVVRLGILWSRGGIYVDPTVRVSNVSMFAVSEDPWVCGSHDSGLLDVCYFPKHHPFISELSERFISEYLKDGGVNFNFQKTVHNVYSSAEEKPPTRELTIRKLNDDSELLRNHFGTLSYSSQLQTCNCSSLEDGMQGYPGLQFLPFVDRLIERNNLTLSAGPSNITTFFNGWWGITGSSWPPPDNISPVMLSLHIDESIQHLWAQEKSYLVKNAPIGCRDQTTLDFLKEHNIEAYFSGPLALMTKNPNAGVKRTEDIYIINVERSFTELLPSDVRSTAVAFRQQPGLNVNSLARYVTAYNLLETLGSAKVVITQCIQYALPCVAMGTPVIFINGSQSSSCRGLDDPSLTAALFHTVDLHSQSTEDAKKWLLDFTWDSPPFNPNAGMAMRLRATAWNVMRRNQPLKDSARKFGLIPMSPPIPGTDDLLFHLIFATSKEDEVETFSGSIKGTFNWRHWRSLESIFFHHPFAKVMIHSNTLSQSEFDVLTEAGYSLEVRKYNFEEMLKDSPAKNFIPKLKKIRESKFWYNNEANLLRLLVLYDLGGVYMDTDVIVVRSLKSLAHNVIAWEDSGHGLANGAFMMFEKGNPFIKACLVEFADTFDGNRWGYNCPQLLTRVWKSSFQGTGHVEILDHLTFYMFFYGSVQQQCFVDTSGATYDSNLRVLKEKAYVVHLNTKLTGLEGITSTVPEGTICKHLLNFYCVLCDKRY